MFKKIEIYIIKHIFMFCEYINKSMQLPRQKDNDQVGSASLMHFNSIQFINQIKHHVGSSYSFNFEMHIYHLHHFEIS